MGSRLFIATALLVFAIGLLSACAQNPSADGVDAQGNQQRSSTVPRETTQQATGYAAATMEEGTSPIAGAQPPYDDVILDKDEYAVTKDGNLIIGGDVQVRCKEIMAISIQGPS